MGNWEANTLTAQYEAKMTTVEECVSTGQGEWRMERNGGGRLGEIL